MLQNYQERNDIGDSDILYTLTAEIGRNEKEKRKIWQI